MSDHQDEIINPIHIDTVIDGTVTASTSDEFPGKVLITAQMKIPPQTSPQTLLIELTQDDGYRLHAALSAWMKGTSN
jgi:hypothetical protein